MEMASARAEQAVEYKHNKCNCAQAVLLAFQKDIGKSAEELLAMGAGFGSGLWGFLHRQGIHGI